MNGTVADETNEILLAAQSKKGVDNQPAIEWIRQHAVPLTTVQNGHDFRDLLPLKHIIGDARLVALGEATHGTREFFQLKSRVVEFLATQMGFATFSIEANMPEAYLLNDYVLNGNGDPKVLLKGMGFWTWDTEEFLQLIIWMHEYNQSGKGHIAFTGFDMQSPNLAIENVQTFVNGHDSTYSDTLKEVYKKVLLEKAQTSTQQFGIATAKFPIDLAVGKHINLSGFIKTDGVSRGYAGLWWRVDGDKNTVLALDNMADRGATGTSAWRRYQISLDIPAEARAVYFGLIHQGNGIAWFDSLQITIDGVPYANSSAFDLDFESTSIRGFYQWGERYKLDLDSTVSHTGRQSLRSSYHENISEENSQNSSTISHECQQVVTYLEARRSDLAQRSNLKEVDWIIQNARLVLQYAQLVAEERTRDSSMAENVKWIADHSPESKLIIWAHNLHIAYQDSEEEAPMGSDLHKMFGTKLVTFGLIFNEGGFRAIEMGKGLREFTVVPLPVDSLDRTLADVGIPLFAIDLRLVPSKGPVADWFAEDHLSRDIGAIYNESAPLDNAESVQVNKIFDGIFFIENTSSSHVNR